MVFVFLKFLIFVFRSQSRSGVSGPLSVADGCKGMAAFTPCKKTRFKLRQSLSRTMFKSSLPLGFGFKNRLKENAKR